jgi:hypothetical protein
MASTSQYNKGNPKKDHPKYLASRRVKEKSLNMTPTVKSKKRAVLREK